VFDAEVIVATSPDGYTGTVELLNNHGQVTSSTGLANNQISFSNNHVRVVVPVSLLPSTSPPGTPEPQDRYSFAFWAGFSPSAPNGVSGFAPEFANGPVPLTILPST
jgi:hypothetical protein